MRDHDKNNLLSEEKHSWLGWGLLKVEPSEGGFEGLSGSDFLVKYVSDSMKKDIQILIEDAVTYIDWALYWPRFVQSVRSIKPATVNLDLRWKMRKIPK